MSIWVRSCLVQPGNQSNFLKEVALCQVNNNSHKSDRKTFWKQEVILSLFHIKPLSHISWLQPYCVEFMAAAHMAAVIMTRRLGVVVGRGVTTQTTGTISCWRKYVCSVKHIRQWRNHNIWNIYEITVRTMNYQNTEQQTTKGLLLHS